MGLSCSCQEWEGEGVAYEPPKDFSKLETSKRKRCSSCNKLIDVNSLVLSFGRFRAPESDVEINIFGDDGEIRLANHYLCEKCGEIYLNIESLGYCVDPDENMNDLLKVYHEISGFKKAVNV